MISQTVDAAATLRGDLDGNCIRLSLTDLSLKLVGVLFVKINNRRDIPGDVRAKQFKDFHGSP